MRRSLSASGVVGLSRRFPLEPADAPLASVLILDGRPLPLVGTLRVYTCGITPYDVTHLGHASVFVWTDLLRSVARLTDVEAVMCRNVTDVDDVLNAAAIREGRHYDEFAATQEFYFDRDMSALDVATPELRPHARAHVQQAIQLAAGLLRRSAAYEQQGHVFFRAGQLAERCGLDYEQALQLSEAYGDQPLGGATDGRRDPLDVPVWRPSDEGSPAWPSPWGWGRPGWHAECAAMAVTAFGPCVDVLVGGADLAFPHHACQSAMVETVTDAAPFARRQMHVGTVLHAGAKMAKSTKNLVLVRDLLKRVPGPVVRLMLLNRGWKDPWEYDDRADVEAGQALERLYSAAGRPAESESARARVTAALIDDLDVPTAVAIAESEGGATARFLIDVLKLSAARTDRR
jgi:cysteinyl-tRNA synthetase